VATLTGDNPLEVGRLKQDLTVGGTTFTRPIVELTDELSSLGSGLLKNFRLTFDQTRNQVTFYRASDAPILTPPLRSTGLSFRKLPAYWRVLDIVPGSPADENGVQSGDLVTRINGDPIAKWDFRRYDELVRTAARIEFTFITGRREMVVPIDTFALVP
jgi:S1-C subfamily serine protease